MMSVAIGRSGLRDGIHYVIIGSALGSACHGEGRSSLRSLRHVQSRAGIFDQAYSTVRAVPCCAARTRHENAVEGSLCRAGDPTTKAVDIVGDTIRAHRQSKTEDQGPDQVLVAAEARSRQRTKFRGFPATSFARRSSGIVQAVTARVVRSYPWTTQRIARLKDLFRHLIFNHPVGRDATRSELKRAFCSSLSEL
jgi:hypothetical protein